MSRAKIFPPSHMANEDGLLAVGGNLDPYVLLEAYKLGIFPWFSDNDPILWWTPDPRCVLFPKDLKISKSMRSFMNKASLKCKVNRNFSEILMNCKNIKRNGQEGTWITDEILEAYKKLHDLGMAHSIEVFNEDQLVGGLYGVAYKQVFYGESMFAKQSNVSKYALIKLVEILEQKNFAVIDCQMKTDHLMSLGAMEIPRSEFEEILLSNHKTGKVVNWKDIQALMEC